MELQALAALVTSQASDINVYAGFLLQALDGALPPSWIEVERRRSMGDRLRGKDASLIGVRVTLGEDTYSLRRVGGGTAVESMIFHQVHGIVLSRSQVPLEQWSLALVTALDELAASNAHAAQALSRLTNFTV